MCETFLQVVSIYFRDGLHIRHNLFDDQLGTLFAFSMISWEMYSTYSIGDTTFRNVLVGCES